MFSKFNEESRKVLTIAKKEMLLLKHAYIGSEHIVLAILKNKNYNVCKILNKNAIDYDGFKKEVPYIVKIKSIRSYQYGTGFNQHIQYHYPHCDLLYHCLRSHQ